MLSAPFAGLLCAREGHIAGGCLVSRPALRHPGCQTPLMADERSLPDAHVIFELEVEDGWPPVGAERVWAFHLGAERYRIDSAPWFARDLAVGDVVRARPSSADSHPVFVELLERSDHITIQLICFRRGPL